MVRRHAVAATTLVLALAGSLGAGPAVSQTGKPEVVVDVSAMKEVVTRDASGKERVELKEAANMGPGDVLVYRIAYSNKGTAPAHDAKVVDPIPAGTRLMPNSWQAEGAVFSVSVDGGRTWEGFPVKRPVAQPDGTKVQKEVDLSSYTHVRWTTQDPLPPGATRSALFKVTVR